MNIILSLLNNELGTLVTIIIKKRKTFPAVRNCIASYVIYMYDGCNL